MRHNSLSLVPLMAVAVFAAERSAAYAGDEAGFRWKIDAAQGQADLLDGDVPVVRYMFHFDTSSPETTHDTYKVFHHIFAPGTGQLITKGPGGKYTHHRGLYLGWRATKFDGQSIDTWHCSRGTHQRHIRFVETVADADHGTMTAEIHWMAPDGKPVIREIRTVAARRSSMEDRSGWQIDWQTQLHSERGDVQLDGDRQHAGFQFRAHQAVADANSARYIRPEGFPQQETAFQVGDGGNPPAHINLGWLAMHFPLGETRYTVEYFEDPSLPRPSLYSERPYGRFGAFFKATVTPDKPLAMRYRLNVSTGTPSSQQAIQQRYEAFVAELQKK